MSVIEGAMSATPLLTACRPGEVTEVGLSLERARHLMAGRGETRCESHESPNGRHFRSAIFGVPRWARLVLVGEETPRLPTDPDDTLVFPGEHIFRHYICDPKAYQAITETHQLIPGPLRFQRNAGGAYYQDLVGVFLTDPSFPPEEVGVPHSHSFVDVLLYGGTGMIQLSEEDDHYFLIPGIPQPYRWFREAYSKWVELGKPDKQFLNEETRRRNYQEPIWTSMATQYENFVEKDKEGGLPDPTRLPVIVVRGGLKV